MNLNDIIQGMLGFFRLEIIRPVCKVTVSDEPPAKKPDMPDDLKRQKRFFYELEAKVIETAEEAGIPINPQLCNAREAAIEGQGEEDYEETPVMFLEDILDEG